MKNQHFDSELERQLAVSLDRRGIVVIREFRVPGGQFVFDFLLPQPPFSVIEVVGLTLSSDARIQQKLARLQTQLQVVRRELGQSARIFLVIVGGPIDQLVSDMNLPEGVVLCAGAVEAVVDQIANDLREHAVLVGSPIPAQVLQELANDDNDLSRTLSQLTLTLSHLLSAEEREVLAHEHSSLHAEIRHGHYTAAALRVGRSTEFVIYSACKSWGVPVNEPILVCLDNLNGRFGEVKNALLSYSAILDDKNKKKKAKREFVAKTNELQKALNQILSEIDENVAILPEERKSPVNLGALLTDIKKRFARLDEVRSEIEAQSKPLRELLDLRNNAAHASLHGSPQEVSHTELGKMIDLLNGLLLCLSKCGTAIELYRKNHERQ